VYGVTVTSSAFSRQDARVFAVVLAVCIVDANDPKAYDEGIVLRSSQGQSANISYLFHVVAGLGTIAISRLVDAIIGYAMIAVLVD